MSLSLVTKYKLYKFDSTTGKALRTAMLLTFVLWTVMNRGLLTELRAISLVL